MQAENSVKKNFVRNKLGRPLIMTLLLIACVEACRPAKKIEESQKTTAPFASSATASPESEISVAELIKSCSFIESETRKGMLRAWSRVPNNASYRAAQNIDSESPITRDYGELAGAHGLATLIVNKTIMGADRMSLIIFVERPDNRSDIYWINRNMDLSRYKMSRASGDIIVDEVHKDGNRSICEIRWDKKERT